MVFARLAEFLSSPPSLAEKDIPSALRVAGQNDRITNGTHEAKAAEALEEEIRHPLLHVRIRVFPNYDLSH